MSVSLVQASARAAIAIVLILSRPLNAFLGNHHHQTIVSIAIVRDATCFDSFRIWALYSAIGGSCAGAMVAFRLSRVDMASVMTESPLFRLWLLPAVRCDAPHACRIRCEHDA
ncbi:hypothetical protein [Burkholderia sp. JKS000303]|uniref:hypothetical protein n=1 Tax=Burkholderia sp. JKS000303 TaxID=1938747 RepID=UPI001180A079|nr:hypothetical protein [Burkholderia sp. JKS000303]